MNDHDIVASTADDVECRCGWTGTRQAHALHRVREPGLAGVAEARRALEEGQH